MFKKKKKFNYKIKNYSNPFFHKKRRRRFINLKLNWSWKAKLLVFLICFLACALVWFLYFSSYFKLTNIEVSGNTKMLVNDIDNLVWEQAEKRRFLIGSQKNLNFFSKSGLVKLLNQKYYFENLDIEKKLPNTIIVKLKEKGYSLIWLESENYYYIDNQGNVISDADPLEIKQKNYPLVDNRGEKKLFNNKVDIDGDNINYIIELFKEFKNNYRDFKIERFILDNEINTIKISLMEGPEIYFNTEKDINAQITKLLVIVNEKLKNNFLNKTYIDLRYGDRVYYR